MKELNKVFYFVILSLYDFFVKKISLERIPEPQLSDEKEQVDAYDRVMETPMSAIYAYCLNKIQKITNEKKELAVIDFFCGPGQFTKWMHDSLAIKKITAVDLSEPMLEKLQKNLQGVHAVKDDVTNLTQVGKKEYDLAVAMNGLHHLPSLKEVSKALREIESVTKDDGVIFIFDVHRLKSKWQSDSFTDVYGMKHMRGLEFFQKDFELSMAAAWRNEELVPMIPKDTNKVWFVLKAFGTQSLTSLIAVPKGKEYLVSDMKKIKIPVTNKLDKKYVTEYNLLNLNFNERGFQNIKESPHSY